MIAIRLLIFIIPIIVISILVSSITSSIFLDVPIIDIWKALISVFFK